MFADVLPDRPPTGFSQTTLYLGPGWVLAGLLVLVVSQVGILALLVILVRRSAQPKPPTVQSGL